MHRSVLPSILAIDEDPVRAAIIEAGLREAGHEKVNVSTELHGIFATIVETRPDVIVIDIANPNRDVLENVFQMSRGQ